MPFPNQDAGVSMLTPLRKLTLDADGVETVVSFPAVFECGLMTNGAPRLLITVPDERPSVFRELVSLLTAPIFLLYILHSPRGEGAAGRYQSPPLDVSEVDDFLTAFAPFLAGDGRHDLWAHSAGDGRTFVWDRHDIIYAEGEPLDEVEAKLKSMGFTSGAVPRLGAGSHIHHYRTEFDADAAAVLARFDWIRTDLRPQDEQ